MDGMSGEIVRRCGYDWWLKPPNDYPLYALPPTCLVLLDTSYPPPPPPAKNKESKM